MTKLLYFQNLIICIGVCNNRQKLWKIINKKVFYVFTIDQLCPGLIYILFFHISGEKHGFYLVSDV